MIDPKSSKEPQKRRLNQERCVVCGARSEEFTGYVFYESGKTRLNAPFCKQDSGKSTEYANPIFQNQAALELFKQMFPQTYLEDVKGKLVLFFGAYKPENSN